jgi:hypothetical protein
MLTKHPVVSKPTALGGIDTHIKLEGDKLSAECVQQLLQQQGPPQYQLQPGQHLQPVPQSQQSQAVVSSMPVPSNHQQVLSTAGQQPLQVVNSNNGQVQYQIPQQQSTQQPTVSQQQPFMQQLPQQVQQLGMQIIQQNGQIIGLSAGAQIPPNAQLIGASAPVTSDPFPQQQTATGIQPGFQMLQQAQYPGLPQIPGSSQPQQPQATPLQQSSAGALQQLMTVPQQQQVPMTSSIPQGGKIINVPGIPGHFVQTGPNTLIQVPPGYVFDQTNSVAVQASQASAGQPVTTFSTSNGQQVYGSMPSGVSQQIVGSLPNGQMIVQTGPAPSSLVNSFQQPQV